jgi:hypothetical protein
MKKETTLVALAALGLLGCDRPSDATKPAPIETKPVTVTASSVTTPAMTTPTQSPLERGAYLVTIGGCDDCHTPKKMGAQGPEPDMAKRLSGQPSDEKLPAPPKAAGPWVVSANGNLTAWAGPWGQSYTANLTPDKETGLGNWTEENFAAALKTGKHGGAPNGRPIQPPMPWFNYGKASDADIHALWMYLQSVPPLKNKVPDAVIAPPPAAHGAPAAPKK